MMGKVPCVRCCCGLLSRGNPSSLKLPGAGKACGVRCSECGAKAEERDGSVYRQAFFTSTSGIG